METLERLYAEADAAETAVDTAKAEIDRLNSEPDPRVRLNYHANSAARKALWKAEAWLDTVIAELEFETDSRFLASDVGPSTRDAARRLVEEGPIRPRSDSEGTGHKALLKAEARLDTMIAELEVVLERLAQHPNEREDRLRRIAAVYPAAAAEALAAGENGHPGWCVVEEAHSREGCETAADSAWKKALSE